MANLKLLESSTRISRTRRRVGERNETCYRSPIKIALLSELCKPVNYWRKNKYGAKSADEVCRKDRETGRDRTVPSITMKNLYLPKRRRRGEEKRRLFRRSENYSEWRAQKARSTFGYLSSPITFHFSRLPVHSGRQSCAKIYRRVSP